MNMQLRDMGPRELLQAVLSGLRTSRWTRKPCHTEGDSGTILARARHELRARGISLAAQVLAIETSRIPVISLAYHSGLDDAVGAMRTGRGRLRGQEYEFWEIELRCARVCWRKPVSQGAP